MAQTQGGRPRAGREIASAEEKKRQLVAALSGGPSSLVPAPPLPTYAERLAPLRQSRPRQRDTVTIGDRTYREVDNGRAGVLVPAGDPFLSPAELAKRQQDIVRLLFMAQNPFASSAYGIAAGAGASPRAQEGALIVGAVADVAASGAAPRNTPVRRPTPAAKAVPQVPRNGSVRYREANADRQSQGMIAVLGASMLGTGGETKRSVRPPGFISGLKPHFHARAHLLGKQLGGHADEVKKIFAANQNPTNNPSMSNFEGEVAKRVRSGEIVDYSVTPIYTPGVPAPRYILMTASGDRGAPVARVIENPLGRPPK